MIEKDCLCIEKESFKLKAKIKIIQNGLQLWKYVQYGQFFSIVLACI